MPRVQPKTVAQVFSNSEFIGTYWPRVFSKEQEKGWRIYRDRVFSQVQKYAPLPKVYQKFDKEVIARSLRLENQVKPEKVWQKLQFSTKLDYLQRAKMVLVFHNYGLGAKEILAVRKIAKNARCEWIQDKSLGGKYADHLGNSDLYPLLKDGGAVLWAAYSTDEFNKIHTALKKYDYSFKLVAGIISNPEYKTYDLLYPPQLEDFSKLPPLKEYIASNLLGPLMAQPYALTGTLMAATAQLSNVLQYQLFKLKEKGGSEESAAGEKKEGGEKKKEGGEKKEAKEKPAAKEAGKEKEKEKEKEGKKDAKPEAPKK